MPEEPSELSVQQAAELVGKSRDTINEATNAGKLSYTLNDSGHKRIAVAELERVYGKLKSPSDAVGKRPKVSASDVRDQLTQLKERLQQREATNETMSLERSREREQLLARIEQLETQLERTHAEHKQAMALLTDQRASRGEETAAQLQQLRDDLADQRVRFDQALSEAQSDTRRRTLHEIKDRPWWELVFSKKLAG